MSLLLPVADEDNTSDSLTPKEIITMNGAVSIKGYAIDKINASSNCLSKLKWFRLRTRMLSCYMLAHCSELGNC